MGDINNIIEHAEKRCKTRGKQLTSKRKLILKALVHADKALSAYDLVDYCKTHFGRIFKPCRSIAFWSFSRASTLLISSMFLTNTSFALTFFANMSTAFLSSLSVLNATRSVNKSLILMWYPASSYTPKSKALPC